MKNEETNTGQAILKAAEELFLEQGFEQTTTKQITIHAEPELVLGGGDRILTYIDNAAAKTSTVTANGVSTITWSVSGYAGATVDGGVVTVANPATAGMDQTLTVTAKTAYGQEKTASVELDVEDKLTLTGDATLNAVQGTSKVSNAYTIGGGSNNTLSVSNANGLDATIVENSKLQVISAEKVNATVVTLKATSEAGQEAEFEVTVTVYPQAQFDTVPTNGVIAYAMTITDEEAQQ